ncbi:sarcosine oxidase subunit beta [Paracoccus alcaliphilus]|uniref:Sarcosine oxidase subunit beta n=1 Tax=Paracoccus alcaliphilus TaxID=34002 RepID=A0A1H8P058_9RHOB|nr:FAD-dependent oxidoreductase [Paracoccus alcaliphilus]WCR21072.1 FAD-binding oxidoreductase [Paracoccus alcaliphilus]SEO35194.1 sarcosine oxidase subunit beta [Paracoccus alcaliphilus]
MTGAVSHSADVIVIGGGIHGASTSLHLARRGYSVNLLERNRIGCHASGVNAGSIHHIPRIHFELPLAESALKVWPEIAEMLGDDCGFRRNGYLRVVETEAQFETARTAMERVRRYSSITEEWLDRGALRDLQPGLGDSITGGIWAAECGSADPARTLHAFRLNLQRAGVGLFEGCRVQAITRVGDVWHCVSATQAFQAPVLINCAGGWGGDIAALVGERFPLTRQALMMSVSARTPALLGPVVGHVGHRLSVKQALNGTYLIGGGYRGHVSDTAVHAGLDHDRLAYNLALAQHVFPTLAQAALTRCWAGLEGFAPDHAGYIGASSYSTDLWHCFGFSAHGFYLGPVVGKLLAQAIDTGDTPKVLLPFLPTRAEGGTLTH